jgi:cellulose synthase/poly-beta-1,6-N-acetylglucosamine synthase-like glycosyltransferase
MMEFLRALREDLHPLVDHTRVDVYGSSHERQCLPLPEASAPRPAVSLITTVKNEGASIQAWLESLLAQTRLPDEIVIVDGGSTDDTLDRLKAFAACSPVPVNVSQVSGANIARGRNLAIERASGPIIACTDAGCMLTPGWLAAITGPFAADPQMEVAAGYYEAMQAYDLQRIMAVYLVPPLHLIDPQAFLPSCRSMAFRKEAWRAAGGFPEWLTLTAEDTFFALALKHCTTRWAFVPEAVVRWHLKPTLAQFFRQVRAYGRGDGEAGLFPGKYLGFLRWWLETSLAGLALIFCLALALVFQAWAGWLAAALLAGWLARRAWRMTLRPVVRLASGEIWPRGPFETIKVILLSALVNSALTLGLAIGFVEGVQRRVKRGLSPTVGVGVKA